MQRAYLAGLIAGAACPLIGTFLVLRRLALIAEGLGHAAFAGAAAGLLLHVHPLVSTVAVSLMGALGIERLRATRRAAGDVAIAIYASLGLGVGMALAKLAGRINTDLLGVLFGSLVAVQPADLMMIAALGAAVMVTVLALYRQLLSITIDEDTARSAGIPVDALNQILVLLTALTVVLAMRVVGLLLVTSLMVLPVATSLQWARGLGWALVGAVGLGMASTSIGLTVAYAADLPAGAAIVLTSVGLFLASLVLSPRRR
ncbi:MAG TPA: metal ABC transporter permease [Bacillota bacterium]